MTPRFWQNFEKIHALNMAISYIRAERERILRSNETFLAAFRVDTLWRSEQQLREIILSLL